MTHATLTAALREAAAAHPAARLTESNRHRDTRTITLLEFVSEAVCLCADG